MVNWKVIAIIFILIATIETLTIGWAVSVYNEEQANMKVCYYDNQFCADYPDALYEKGICYCYDYDVLGDLRIVKTILME